jgi:hypothetical protein
MWTFLASRLDLIVLVLLVCVILFEFVYKPLRPGYITVYIIDKTKRIRRLVCKLKVDDSLKKVTIGRDDYIVTEDQVYSSGMFRVPTVLFNDGDSSAHDLLKRTRATRLASAEVHERTEQHIATDLINSFKELLVDTTTSMIIIIIIILGAIGYSWWDLGKQLDVLSEAVGVVTK